MKRAVVFAGSIPHRLSSAAGAVKERGWTFVHLSDFQPGVGDRQFQFLIEGLLDLLELSFDNNDAVVNLGDSASLQLLQAARKALGEKPAISLTLLPDGRFIAMRGDKVVEI